MRSINLRKMARPGKTKEQANLSMPVSDWTSLSVTFIRVRKLAIRLRHLSIFSRGKGASKETESNLIPKDNVLTGPHVFSPVMGMPRCEHGSRNMYNSSWHND